MLDLLGRIHPVEDRQTQTMMGLLRCPSQAVMQKGPEILVGVHAAGLACEGQFET